ncbi:uncharacterized protein L203_106462 [Cryptococcus depauperatus CBS 7841]|uniref:Uncharacterized protein n=1 Tax=Cryptococcus depauperatus CBS 7841 TaxID=1295531 RepID=A0AAJ8JZE3_9TREE
MAYISRKPPSRLAQSTFLASEHQTLSVAYTPDQTLGDPASIKRESSNFMMVTNGMLVGSPLMKTLSFAHLHT